MVEIYLPCPLCQTERAALRWSKPTKKGESHLYIECLQPCKSSVFRQGVLVYLARVVQERIGQLHRVNMRYSSLRQQAATGQEYWQKLQNNPEAGKIRYYEGIEVAMLCPLCSIGYAELRLSKPTRNGGQRHYLICPRCKGLVFGFGVFVHLAQTYRKSSKLVVRQNIGYTSFMRMIEEGMQCLDDAQEIP